jgi:hypothetical protein
MSELRDPDGLPIPDQATLARLWNEAQKAPLPSPRQWVELLALLRWAAEVRRHGEEADNAPQGTTAPRLALAAIIGFLSQQECVLKHGASMPLIDLQNALTDLADGIVSNLRPSPSFRRAIVSAGRMHQAVLRRPSQA